MISFKNYLRLNEQDLWQSYLLYAAMYLAIYGMNWLNAMDPSDTFITHFIAFTLPIVAVGMSAVGIWFLALKIVLEYHCYAARMKRIAAATHMQGAMGKAINDYAKAYKSENQLDITRSLRILFNEIQVHSHLAYELPCIQSKIEGAFEALGIDKPVNLNFLSKQGIGEYVLKIGDEKFKRSESGC